jgi:hypothetical protein
MNTSIKTIYFLLLCLIFSCRKEGPAGKNSLLSTYYEPWGANCPKGGLKIMSGIDVNENGILDNDEVQNTKYMCNVGFNSLIKYDYESGGNHCTSGGYKISSGMDLNLNNILDANEIQNSIYICNGIDGIIVGDSYEKQIIIFLAFGSMANNQPPGNMGAIIPEFNISNYINADSISFGAYIRTSDPFVSCYLDLYNFTNNTPINNTLLVTNSTVDEWKTTNINFINDLPKNTFTLGYRLRTQVEDKSVYMRYAQIRIYRK